MQDAFAYCAELVRSLDRDRFIATLFAPAEQRDALYALYAFNTEVARVRELAHTALAGEIRLQWWGEAIDGAREDEAQANPVATALLETIERHKLSRATLIDLIEARRFDLYEEPMAEMADLDRYAQRTSSSLIALAGQVLTGAEHEAVAAPAGIALGITSILRALPDHVARHQLYLPTALIERHGVRLHELFAGRASTGLASALAELRGRARQSLHEAGERLAALPPQAMAAFLPLALVRPWLDRLERSAPLTPVTMPPWRRQWLIWRAALNPKRIAG